MKKILFLLVFAVCSIYLSSCSSSSSTTKSNNNSSSVYAEMGGDVIVREIVAKTLTYASNDTRTSKFLTSSTTPLVKTVLTAEVCNAIGGPCEHSAITLREAIKDPGFNAASGNALIENIGRSMNDLKVSADAKDDAMSSLASNLLKGL